MYSIYQEASTNCVFDMISNVYDNKRSGFGIWYDNNTPYVKYDKQANESKIEFLECVKKTDTLKLFSQILKIYDMNLDSKWENFIDRNGVMQNMEFCMGLVNGYLLEFGKIEFYAFSVFDLVLGVVENDKIELLAVLFLIDPLRFITKIRTQINVSKAKDFFDSVEYYVNKKLDNQLIKYFVLRRISQKYGVVNDCV